jgi:histidinol dehydrogenase
MERSWTELEIIKKAKEQTQREETNIISSVSEIIRNVRIEGDDAIRKYNSMFDGNENECFRVSRDEIELAYSKVDKVLIEDIKAAANNITAFAKLQRALAMISLEEEISPGVVLGHRKIPVDACCCYVPGGNYPLFSTALMLAIPAKISGVSRVVACSPAIKASGNGNSNDNGGDNDWDRSRSAGSSGGSGSDNSSSTSGGIHPLTLVAMDIAGVDEIYTIGGAQAIAAFAYGTNQIKPVDLIVGPGNKYVTEAKRQCFGQIGIDFIAGPSEVLIIADATANPKILAADLLSQSEHDISAKGILVTTSKETAKRVEIEIEKQLLSLQTSKIASKAWYDNGEILVVESLEQACELSNAYAPEHLELIVEEEDKMIPLLSNYGSLFIGEMSAEVFGDYVSGTNHTLPTSKAARYTGGVWVGTFIKTCTYQKLGKIAIEKLGPIALRMAKAEGLYAHANAADIRLEIRKI